VDLYVNGVQKAVVSTALTLASRSNYTLFNLGGSPTQYNFAGDAYEFIIYSRVLSTTSRLRVQRYLAARYQVGTV